LTDERKSPERTNTIGDLSGKYTIPAPRKEMLSVDITGLTPGIHKFELAPETEDLNLDPEEFSDIHVDVRLDFEPGRILVQFKVSGIATLVCDRTLVTFERPIEDTYSILFSKDGGLVSDGDEYDDVRSLDQNANWLDITDAARDTLLLAVPLRRVAPEAEGAVLPFSFGLDDETVDPRWEALRSLKS
jgi:uncharacterized protein